MSDVEQRDLDVLGRALEFEQAADPDIFTLGWRWHDVSAHTAHLTKLVIKQLIRISYKSHSETRYRLTDVGIASVVKGLPEVEEPKLTEQVGTGAVSDSMFNDIVGYDDIKELISESLQLDKPIHVLLVGPPSLAKTMFLWGVERAYGDLSIPLIGSATSHAGLWDLIAEKRPRIILIDEIEKMGLADMAGLLALMEQGRIIRAKVNRRLDIRLTVWVIAAANKTLKMPVELLSRFAKFDLTEYTSSEFRTVVTSVLVAHEATPYNDAAQIATRLLGKSHDVRDAVRVARLAKRIGVKRAVELLIK